MTRCIPFFVVSLVQIQLQPPSFSDIIDELIMLTRFDTNNSFLRNLEMDNNYEYGACKFESQKIKRGPQHLTTNVACLVIHDKAAWINWDKATQILYKWMAFENLDYYRIQIPNTWVFFYDQSNKEAVLWKKGWPAESTISKPIERQLQPWESNLFKLKALASRINHGQIS